MKHLTKRLSLVLSFFCGFTGTATAQASAYQPQLDSLFQGFKTKNYAFIKPLLDSKATIGTLPGGMNDAVVPQVINQLPAPIAYTTDATTSEAAGTRVSTTYTYAGGLTRRQSFLFNAAGKITDFDVLEGLQTMAATGAPVSTPNAFEVPFELHQHIIFVKAQLNGKEEDFILDSGAPTLILNSDETPSITTHQSGTQAMGVGGTASVSVAHIESLNWQGVELKGADVVSMSLRHLELQAGHRFAGLIGYTIFQDYEVTFDYARKVITFVKMDANGTPLAPTATGTTTPSSTVPLEMHQHIPVFTMSIGGKAYHMGLDCGAGSNLLYAKYMPDIQSSIKGERRARIAGAGAEKVKADAATVTEATVGATLYKNMSFVFEDATLDQVNTGYNVGIDGLLGYEFLRQYKTTVNFRKGELRIYQ